MARPEKVAVVEEIADRLANSDAAVLTEYRGLTVSGLADLRAALVPAATEYKVFKNTLARRAVTQAGLADLVPLLEGPVAIAFVKGDVVVAARALRDFAKTTPELILKGGILGTRILSASDITRLADVEPREVLLAKLAGGFQAPLVKAAGLFSAIQRNMAYGIKALIDQHAAETPTQAETPTETETPAETETPTEAETPAEAETPTEAETPAETDTSGEDS